LSDQQQEAPVPANPPAPEPDFPRGEAETVQRGGWPNTEKRG
jgi:hypothetical protein